MTTDRPPETPPEGGRGLIALFVRHPTAANLVMLLMMLLGLIGIDRMNTQFFPEFGIDVVSVSVAWPGAAAEDIDASIVQPIEREVRFLDEVKRVRSNSTQGIGLVYVEFLPGADMQSALSNVESAVGQVTTLPQDSERPEIRRFVRYDTIARIVVGGPFPERFLKSFAKTMRDDLIDRGVDQVELAGAREEEIWVELAPERLRELDLTIDDVASRIAAASQDLPSGDTRGAAVRQLRSLGLARDAEAVAAIEVRADADGQRITVRDLATVREAFDEEDETVLRRGSTAIELHVLRATTADALETAAILDAYIADLQPTLPPELSIELHDVAAGYIEERIDLLLKNGLGGLVLVLAILFVFLNGRVAFWVGMGIPASLLAACFVMWLTGQSINMISLFGMLLVLGIIVDDAIVVGEHSATLRARGLSPELAAELGARRMVAPVTAAMLTTVASFLPLFVIGDVIGTIIGAIPLVVVAALAASLIECFTALPGHMRSALDVDVTRREGRFRRTVDGAVERFRDGPFRRFVASAMAWRYLTLACAVAALVASVGLMSGGRVGFNFFPSVEADRVFGNVQLVSGSSRDDTRAALREMEEALLRAEQRFIADGHDPLVRLSLLKVGVPSGEEMQLLTPSDQIGSVVLELTPPDEREVRTDAFIAAWREEIRPIAGVESLTLRPPQGGPPGREIDVRISGDDLGRLKAGAERVKRLLSSYPGVTEIDDDLPWGKLETILTLTPKGAAMGFTTESVGRQVRNAFEGAIAKRFVRGDEEVWVRVGLDRARLADLPLHDLYVRGPDGAEVPLGEVVDLRDQRGFAQINREDGAREVAITAEVDETVTSAADVLAALQRDGLAEIATEAGGTFRFAGKAEEQAATFADMQMGTVMALASIYIVLAWVFGSWARPFAVMAIIPFGFLGAVVGHWVMGYDLTILSMIGLLGLSGVLVNDSIVLISTIDDLVREGRDLREAIVDGACERLRAVFLTSATTIGGLAPMMFERSLQAQFLVPMAITIVFGLLVATLLVLLIAPAMVAVGDDVARAFAATRRKLDRSARAPAAE